MRGRAMAIRPQTLRVETHSIEATVRRHCPSRNASLGAAHCQSPARVRSLGPSILLVGRFHQIQWRTEEYLLPRQPSTRTGISCRAPSGLLNHVENCRAMIVPVRERKPALVIISKSKAIYSRQEI